MPAPITGSRAHLIGLVTVLAMVMATGTIIAPTLAVLASFLLDDLAISRSQLGWVIGAFSISAALMSPQAGAVTDRLGGRRAALAVLWLGAIALAVVAGSPNVWILAAGAIIGGAAQSAANPSTNKLIASLVPAGQRGLVMGFKQSGVQAGVLLTGLSLPAVALAWGWQVAVAVLVTVPMAALALAWLILPTSTEAARRLPPPPDGPVPLPIRWLAWYGFLMGLAGGSITSYLPLFAEEAVGVSVTTAGVVAALSGASAFLARIWFAHLSEGVSHFGRPLGLLAVGAAGATLLLLAANGARGLLLWPGALMVGLTTGAWNSVAMLAVISETGTESAGRGSGVVLLGFLLGFGLGPPAFGASVDAASSYAPALGVALGLFLLAALSMVIWTMRAQRSASPTR